MTEFNPITTLKINDGEKDYEVEAKVSFAFDQKAEKFSQETTDENGRKERHQDLMLFSMAY